MKRIILAALVGVLVSGPAWGAQSLCERLESQAFKVYYRIKLLDVKPTDYATNKYDKLFDALSSTLSAMKDADCNLDYIRETSDCLQKVASDAFGYGPTTNKRADNPIEYMASEGVICGLRGPGSLIDQLVRMIKRKWNRIFDNNED